jgi:hypothetical protein
MPETEAIVKKLHEIILEDDKNKKLMMNLFQ